MIMHVCPIARDKIEHPTTKIVRTEEIDLPLFLRHHFIEIHEIHSCTSLLQSYLDCSSHRNPFLQTRHCQARPDRLYLTGRRFLTYLQSSPKEGDVGCSSVRNEKPRN